MGYYYNDKYSTILDFDNTKKVNNFYQNGIILVNNEDTIFDFSNYIQDIAINNILKEDNPDILTERTTNLLMESAGIAVKDCLFKISINYKDGKIDVLNKPSNNSRDWLKVNHKFAFTTEKYFNLDPGKVHEWPTIDITLYNLYGFSESIAVPFSLRKSSFNQSNTKLKLISANIRNDNKIAYTFLDENTNQLILTTSKFVSLNHDESHN